MHYHLIVIGMGLSGLMAARTAVEAGKRVLVIGKGMGSLCLFGNSVDLLGTDCGADVVSRLSRFIETRPGHPYAKAGAAEIGQALASFQSLFEPPYRFGNVSGGANSLIPTGAGTFRETYLVPSTMAGGVNMAKGGAVIVGVSHFKEFYPRQAAAGIPGRPITVSMPGFIDREIGSSALARLMEKRPFRLLLAKEVKARMEGEKMAGFPAVLGMRNPGRVKAEIEDVLGAEVFEMPILPPSIPGIRVFNRFRTWLIERGVTFLLGPSVQKGVMREGRCQGVYAVNEPLSTLYTADAYVLATGRFLSGGLAVGREKITEPLFGLPVAQPAGREAWFGESFFDRAHPVQQAGILTDRFFRPVDDEGRVLLDNLFVAGSMLAGHNYLSERSREGISLSTGYAAARHAVGS